MERGKIHLDFATKMAREDLIMWGELPSPNEPLKWVKGPTRPLGYEWPPKDMRKRARERAAEGAKAWKEGTPGYTFPTKKHK